MREKEYFLIQFLKLVLSCYETQSTGRKKKKSKRKWHIKNSHGYRGQTAQENIIKAINII